MGRLRMRLAAVAAMTGLTLFVVGCAGNGDVAKRADPNSASAEVRTLPRPFTITARYAAKALGLNHPVSLAISADGNLYVTDAEQRVTVISPAGKVLERWGKPGSGPGEFRFVPSDPTTPNDVHASITTSPGGQVYVSDSGNGRVQEFTPEGRFVRQFGSYGGAKGQFLLAYDLAVDQAGDVYVTDDQAGTLTKFSRSGKVLWQIGNGISGDPDLNGLFKFTSFDSHGRLVVVNDDPNRLLYLDPNGRKVDAFSPSTAGSPTNHICHATVDAAGNTYVSGCGTNTGPTLVYDRAHRLIADWPGKPCALLRSPVFGPHGEVFALATDGSILRLRITLPGA